MASSTSDWMHFHQNSSSTSQLAPSPSATSPSDLFFWPSPTPGQPTDSTVVSTAPPSGPARPGPEGRVSKPARRRTRASRRTPTTLLNTDTSNFRAMVQQFTGGPAFSSPPPVGGGGFSVLGPHAFGPGRAHMIAGPGSGFGLLGHQLQPVQYGISSSNNNSSSGNNNNNNVSSSNLQGIGDLFMNSSGSSENRGGNNGGFQF